MLPNSVVADFHMIDRQIEEVRKIDPSLSSELLGMSTQYLCVVIAGRLEQGLKEILSQYAASRSSVQLDRAIARLCGMFQNPRPQKILELIELFKREARQSLEAEWDQDSNRTSESIASLVGTRITIAHQKSRNAGVSIERVVEYSEAYKRVLRKVSSELNGV